MRVVFAGTPEFSVPCLRVLLADADVEVVAVYTQPDRPAGRGKKNRPSPVKILALENNVTVFQPQSFAEPEEIERLKSLRLDLMVVTAYGLILPREVLDIPVCGCINVHASLLPRWRGAAPIQRAIEAGDTKTGVTLMQMEAALDTGAMLIKATADIAEDDTGGTLHDRLSVLGGAVLAENIHAIINRSITPVPQDDREACYAGKLEKSESLVNWRDSAEALERKIRALNPWPVATTRFGETILRLHEAKFIPGRCDAGIGEVIKADRDGIVVQTGRGGLSIRKLQKPGGRPMTAEAFINGFPIASGMRFGSGGRV